MCFIIFVVLNVIFLLRFIWNIIGWSDIFWLNKKVVGLVSFVYVVLIYIIMFIDDLYMMF